MIYFSKQNKKGEVTARSTKYKIFPGSGEKVIKSENGSLVLVIDDKDLLRSSRLWKKVGKMSLDIFDSVYDYYQDVYIAQSHTLKKIQGQLRQRIEGIIKHPLLEPAENYEQQKQIIVDLISKSPSDVADALIYLKKRVFELGAHMPSFEILHMGEHLPLDKDRHNIRRLILNVWHGFDDIFKQKGIRYKFYFEDGIAEENKCLLDYKIFNNALYNIFDNAGKYCMPGSEVRFNFETEGEKFILSISMLSLPIEIEELSKIGTLGYRGKSCKDLEGSGVGLYIANKALRLNNLEFEIIPGEAMVKVFEDKEYRENIFQIKGSLS